MADLSTQLSAAAAADARPASVAISCVVPMHNEVGNAAPFLRKLAAQLRALSPNWEIVVVDDGSRDGTRAAVLECAVECHVRYLDLSRNFGKEAALTAGLDAARGDVVVMIDADFQHPIDVVPVMLARWREGYQMVYGVRTHRQDESRFKRAGAWAFYRLLGVGANVEIPADAGDFRLLDRKVVDALRRLPERTRFMKGLYAWVGFRSVPVAFTVQPRSEERSSFNARRLLHLASVGLTAFSTLPLRIVSAIGMLISLAALAYGGWVVVEALVFGIQTPGYATLAASIMFFSGLQLVSIGIIGEYLGRVFDEVKARPNYVISEDLDASPLRTAPARGWMEAQ